jgi:hypothetical protein
VRVDVQYKGGRIYQHENWSVRYSIKVLLVVHKVRRVTGVVTLVYFVLHNILIKCKKNSHLCQLVRDQYSGGRIEQHKKWGMCYWLVVFWAVHKAPAKGNRVVGGRWCGLMWLLHNIFKNAKTKFPIEVDAQYSGGTIDQHEEWDLWYSLIVLWVVHKAPVQGNMWVGVVTSSQFVAHTLFKIL